MKMNNRIATLLVVLAALPFTAAGHAWAKDDAAGVQEAIVKSVVDRIKVKATLVSSEAVKKLVALPVYDVTINITMGVGSQTMKEKVIVDGKTVITLPSLTTDMKVDELTKIIDKKFKLTQATTKDFAAMLDVLYPTREDKGGKMIVVKGTQFTFITGKFFDSQTGFIVTTDASGAITDVSYSLNTK